MKQFRAESETRAGRSIIRCYWAKKGSIERGRNCGYSEMWPDSGYHFERRAYEISRWIRSRTPNERIWNDWALEPAQLTTKDDQFLSSLYEEERKGVGRRNILGLWWQQGPSDDKRWKPLYHFLPTASPQRYFFSALWPHLLSVDQDIQTQRMPGLPSFRISFLLLYGGVVSTLLLSLPDTLGALILWDWRTKVLLRRSEMWIAFPFSF